MNILLKCIRFVFCAMGPLWILFSSGYAQQPLDSSGNEGVRFEKDLTWSELFKKAEAEQKMVLFEVYTTWCAPCKHLEANVYPVKEVGDFFNKHFVNFKIQMDRKDTDDAYTKSRYALADSLKSVFDIRVFPTFFFLNSKGELMHVMTGAGDPIPEFLARIAEGIHPETQYYTRVKAFESLAAPDTATVRTMTELAAKKYDWDRVKQYSAVYFDIVGNQVDHNILAFAKAFNRESDYKSFSWLIDHRKEIDALTERGYADRLVMDVLLKEEFYKSPQYSAEKVDWKLFRKNLKVKYPYYADMFTAYAKVQHSTNREDWDRYANELTRYMKKYVDYTPVDGLKTFSWLLVRHVDKRDLLEQALTWMPRVYMEEDNYINRQTEACLLYKVGRTEEAIKVQEKVIADAHEYRKSLFQGKLDRMKEGKPLFDNP
ncbi:thioredoxin family protein [Sphingobacterium faecale]|uniref:Thioredoxin family protein n=1 Tax=Sphingobacterium faecale TaxID=2803775 RepID=A0ABS1R957_9SPHI|nr:thioredoxin family protein [Sphingobacterium faecale]MBL1410830.1 thioredoxin family protein [Sphingobacterium faecale]